QCVAAIDLHLVDGDKTGLDPAFPRLQYVIGRGGLDAEMRKRSPFRIRDLIQHEVQRGGLDIKLCVTHSRLFALFAGGIADDRMNGRFALNVLQGFDSEQLFVEIDTLIDIRNVQGYMWLKEC